MVLAARGLREDEDMKRHRLAQEFLLAVRGQGRRVIRLSLVSGVSLTLAGLTAAWLVARVA